MKELLMKLAEEAAVAAVVAVVGGVLYTVATHLTEEAMRASESWEES